MEPARYTTREMLGIESRLAERALELAQGRAPWRQRGKTASGYWSGMIILARSSARRSGISPVSARSRR